MTTESGIVPRSAGAFSPRVAIWIFHLALPLLGLWLLLARPELDLVWEDHLSHFVLVLVTALVNVVLAVLVGAAAARRDDARLFLVSLTFLAAAGFLGLHALATPGVVAPGANAGFVFSTPVGLFLAGIIAALSAVDWSPAVARTVVRWRAPLVGLLVAVMVGWLVLSLSGISMLSVPVPAEEARGPLRGLAAGGVVLYVLGSLGYYRLYRRRPSAVSVGIITAFALLAEALVAMAESRNWHASWWEWHLLMTLAFGFVAYSAHVQYRREGAATALFSSISLEQTVRQLRDEYSAALEAYVAAIEAAGAAGTRPHLGAVAARLADTFDLGVGQTDVLGRAAEALVAERDQARRLDAIVRVGQEARVILSEAELLERARQHLLAGFTSQRPRILVLREGRLVEPSGSGPAGLSGMDGETDVRRAMTELVPVEGTAEGGQARLILPLTVKDRAAGVMVAEHEGPLADRERALLETAASQLSIALENARLYGQLDRLFRSYLSPEVATALLADPERARLGGAVAEVTVLFADLRGYTSFSERSRPEDVVELLNRYFGAVVPIVLGEGGTVVQFMGDAIMAIWNAPIPQPDHALRAARAALAMQRAVSDLASDRDDWPRFRIGIETGPALVGNVGGDEVRSFTAIGDTTNLAARLQTAAAVGQVVLGPAAYALVREAVVVRSIGALELKGKGAPVEAWELVSLR